MKKDIKWLKEEVMNLYPNHSEMYEYPDYLTVEKVDLINNFIDLIDQLDETEKPVLPQFVEDWIDTHNLYGNNPLREYRDLENDFNEGWTNEKDAAVYHWVNKNPYAFIDALRYGYEVEKEILWEIPMPDLKTTGGHIQYLTYDPKAKTYFASRRNAQLKQTFNAKDLASVPTPHRHYAVLCDFKKIEEVRE